MLPLGWLRLGWLLLGVLCGGAAVAQDVLPVPPLSARVIDQTGTLDAAQRSALTDKLAALEQRSGSQLAVLMVPTTQPEDIATYAQRVADQWKIGRRQVGDGLLIVVAKNDRKVRIEVAKALEGAIPDLLASRVIAQQITPAFKANDYAGGLDAAVDRLAGLIRGEGLPAPADSGNGALRGDAAPGIQWQELAMFFFVGVPVVGAVLSGLVGRKFGSVLTAGAAGGIGWWLTASALLAGVAGLLALLLVGVFGVGAASSRGRGATGGGWGGMPIVFGSGGGFGGGGFGGGGGGGGGFGSGGGGGGFSSGGGGDFGGGGASGSW